MKNPLKKLFSLLLVFVLIGSMFPTVAAESESAEYTQENYASVDALFDKFDEMENEPAKKNATETQLADEAEGLVKASADYVPGSLERNGNSFTWWTTDGIRCVYSPRMREIEKNMVAPENPIADGAYNEPVATKGGWPSSNQVFLIGPYYGRDSNFSDQYKYEAKDIAAAMGDTDGYTLYSGTAATVDKIAYAMSTGAVVIFDSHGNTDYENGYDYVTGATSSYLCLTSTSGLTAEDYNDGALYYSDGIYINGATIVNHMTSNSPGGILWMAICLGMATDTFSTPLRAAGVEVVCGYSQSVTFDGDYLWESVFWDSMIAGNTVAQASAAMKSQWGEWDYNKKIANYYGYTSSQDYYATIAEARAGYSAFPIVVSDEDSHPGQRNKNTFYGADSLQTVKSTYTLYSQYNITAKSNNTAYGSVSVNRSTITATPASGYFAESATVLSGNATVTQNGNSFTVKAESDCTVQINFAPKTAVTVSFSGATIAAQSGYAGDSMALPNATAPEGYKFLGWMSAPLSGDTTEKPASFMNFIPTGSTTLYALYSYVDEDSGSGTGDYVKVTSSRDDWSGEYVIVYENNGYILNSSLSTMDAVSNYKAVSITDNTISAAQADAYKFTIVAISGGYSIQGASGSYIGGSAGKNTLTTSSSAMVNTISIDASGNANIISNSSYLRFNNASDQYRFRYYKSASYSSQQPVALYIKDGSAGTTYYTGNPIKCEHTSATNTAAVAATCTTGGYTAGVYCNDCESYVSGHEAVPALGHSWGNWVQTAAPTCTNPGAQNHICGTCGASETQAIAATGHSYNAVVTPPTTYDQGYTTYTCASCGNSYVSDYTAALGETYTVRFSVPAEVSSVAAMTCGKTGITLPAANAPTGYTFAGWATKAIKDTETAPTLYKANSTYTATANITLYAVYTYVVGGTGESGYVLKDISEITADDQFVITMQYGSTVYALPNNGGSSVPAATIISASNGKLTGTPAANLLWNLGSTSSGYIFYPNGKTSSWLYCTNTNKGVKVGTDSAKTFVIDSNSGYLKHLDTNRYVGVYRTNPDWRCYTNSAEPNIADQTLGFYVKSAGGTTWYTSLKTAEPVAQVGATDYTSFEEAVSNCGDGQYVRLLSNVEAEVILEADLYIDLNGYDLTGLLETNGFTVYGMDTTTDSYDGSNAGIFNCLDINDNTVVPAVHHKIDGKRYLAVNNGGYSFHRFYLGITHATVKPATNGVGYKAAFYGDDAVKSQLASYGYALQLGSDNDPVTVTKDADTFVSGKIITLRVDNYNTAKFGEETLSAKVTMTLTDGTVIESSTFAMSLRSMMEKINAGAAALSATQLSAIKTMIANNPAMADWDLDNL